MEKEAAGPKRAWMILFLFFYVIDIFVFLFLRRGGRRIGWSVWVLREGESCLGTPPLFSKRGSVMGVIESV